MQITIFGANGKVGSLVVEMALQKGLHVVAFSHGKSLFTPSDNLRIVQGDVYNAADVSSALSGSDVVVSTLGSWGTPKKDILTKGMQNIIPSMQHSNIKRIISLTGADAYVKGDANNIFQKIVHACINLAAKKILQDGEQHIQLLKNSDLDWTVLRSPVMNTRGDYKKYALISKKTLPWQTIHRKSVAKSLIDQINDTSHIHSSPFIHRT